MRAQQAGHGGGKKAAAQSRGLLVEEAAERRELFAEITRARAVAKSRRQHLAAHPAAVFKAKRRAEMLAKNPAAVLPEPGPNFETVAMYQGAVERLLRDTPGETWIAAMHLMDGRPVESAATWNMHSSALNWWALKQVDALLASQERMQEGGARDPWHPNFQIWSNTVRRLKFAREILELAPHESPIEEKRKRVSKRGSLAGLTDNWIMEVYSDMAGSRWQLPFLAAAVTGSRPAEMTEGLSFTATSKFLKIRLAGAKFSDISGQEWRELTWEIGPNTSPAIREMHRLAMDAHGSLKASFDDPCPEDAKSPFSKAIARAVKRLYPRHKHRVSAYSLRNAYASDCKASEVLTDDQKSQSLGHIAAETKGFYGSKRASRAGYSVAPTTVTAKDAVRPGFKHANTMSLGEVKEHKLTAQAAAKKMKAKTSKR
ncbi:MAG: hypothetical protein V4787_02235 [Pseudomonadota bacterium]